MTELDRLAAGCLLPSFPGFEVPAWVSRWLERGLGGVTLFAYNVGGEGPAELTAALRAQAPGLLVATDEEGGDVTRLEAARGSSYPGNLALGIVDDVELTRAVAAAIAVDLARAGINLNLAPVADVNTNPRNPVIGVRSFGSDPELVARHVAAFVDGTQAQGVAACAKHFPGHGDTAADSHRSLPVAGGDLQAALAPFRAAVLAGVRAVMTGHVVVPAFGGEPATISRPLVSGLLREELAFRGLVVSDALEMRALSGSVGVEEGAVQALAAGVDALCLGHDLHEEAVASVHAAVVAAVRFGRLPLERVAEAAARVRETAEWASAPTPAAVDGAAIGLEAARRALRVHGDVRVGGPPLVVELVPEANLAAGESDRGLADAWPEAVGIRLRDPGADLRVVADEHPTRPLVLVVRDAALHEWQQHLAGELLAVRPAAAVVELGLPGWRPTGDIALVETAGAGRANLLAAVERLRGEG